MKRRNRFVLLAVIVLVALAAIIGGCGGGGGGDNPPGADNPPGGDNPPVDGRVPPRDIPEKEIYQLVKDGKLSIYVNLYGSMELIGNGDNGDGVGEIFRNTVNTVDEAIYELNNVKTILGLSDPAAELSGEMMNGLDERIYYLYQSYKGIPVDGAEIRVIVNNEGNVRTLMNAYVKIRNDLSVTPSITSGDAEGIVRRSLEAEIIREGRNPDDFRIQLTSRLIVYASGKYELNPVLVWRVISRVTRSSQLNLDGEWLLQLNKEYFVDQEGQIIEEFSYIRTIAASGIDVLSANRDFTVDNTPDGRYAMHDPVRNIITYDCFNNLHTIKII